MFPTPEFENNYFTEMCSGSEAGSYLRLIDFVYHSILGLRVIKKQKKIPERPPNSKPGWVVLRCTLRPDAGSGV